VFRTNSANIFYQPLPSLYRETEKGGEGGKDTRTTTGNGVTRHVARGYLRAYSLRRWRGTWGRPPRPYNPTPLVSFATAVVDLEDGL
jgi:hypothetical protein